MNGSQSERICLVPRLSGVGGMVSFQYKLAAGLRSRGIEITYELDDFPYQAVLVIGGTRRIGGLWRTKRRGVRVVQRLDGMNWLHKLRQTGMRHYLRAEYGNVLLGMIRSHLADHVVYQSEFARRWWEEVRGKTPAPSTIVYNGVNLDTYSPEGKTSRPENRLRLLLVEGSLMGGYELGLEVAVEMANGLAERMRNTDTNQVGEGNPIELMVVGRVSQDVKDNWERHARVRIHWAGQVPQERIPEIDRSAHLLYSGDVNPACPNSVIEALACGLPVVAFDTGALPELVNGEAGRVAAYGGDPWQLDPPDIQTLVEAGVEVLRDQERFRRGARERAEAMFGLDKMVERYLDALLG